MLASAQLLLELQSLRDDEAHPVTLRNRKMTEAEKMAKRIEAAFEACGARKHEVKSAIAQELGISRQAIDGWTRTGRVGKGRLEVLARYTGQSLDYFLGLASMTAAEEREVELVAGFRELPEELREKVLSDIRTYRELQTKQAAKLPASGKHSKKR